MLVEKVNLEYILDFTDIIANNYDTIRAMVGVFVKNKYNKDYNYGVEYYYDYKIIHLQECADKLERRIIITLSIYKDIKLAELETEVEERLESGL